MLKMDRSCLLGTPTNIYFHKVFPYYNTSDFYTDREVRESERPTCPKRTSRMIGVRERREERPRRHRGGIIGKRKKS